MKEILTFIGNYLIGLVGLVFTGVAITGALFGDSAGIKELAQIIGFSFIVLFPLWWASEKIKEKDNKGKFNG